MARLLEEGEEASEILRRRISSHPLYGLLKETYLDCFKVCLGEMEEIVSASELREAVKEFSANMANQSDLDHFMVAYCMSMVELKETMKEQQQKTLAFISSMHCELQDLMTSSSSHSSAEKVKPDP